MRLGRFACVVTAVSFCLAVGAAGADFGTTDRRFAEIPVARPPDQLLRGRTLQLKTQNDGRYPAIAALTASITQAMAAEFTLAAADPDLTLTVNVTAYEPIAIRNYTDVERTGPGGIFTRQVQYWEARAKLSAQVSVVSRSAVSVDSFFSEGVYLRKIATGENGKPNQVRLPTRQELDADLLETAAAQVRRRYTRTTEKIQVRMAVPDPLKDGLRLAERGQWKEALAQWSAAEAPRHPAERAYNMAVAYEWLFYNSEYIDNPEIGQEPLDQAVRLYAEALRLDPGEAQFRLAADRSTQMQANFGRANQQAAILERERAILEASVPSGGAAGPGAKSVADGAPDRPDTTDEADFRENVRTRLKGRTDAPPADYLANLEKTGAVSYKLAAPDAARIVAQEAARWETFKHNMTEYRQMVADFTDRDKTLDAKERDQLDRFAARAELTREDAAAVEAAFKFTDLAKPASTPAPAPPRR